MILAAGRGERMRPLTDHTPKPLLQVGGKPLIVWHIEKLQAAGFHDIVINHAHLGKKIEATLGNGADFGVSIQYSPEPEAFETAGGIAQALPLLGIEPFLVVNGDVFTDYDFKQLEQSLNENLLAWLVMITNPEHHPTGDFALLDGLVQENGEQRLTFSGIGIYHPSLFSGITRGEKARLAPILREAMRSGKVGGEYYEGRWVDVGTPQRLAELDKTLT